MLRESGLEDKLSKEFFKRSITLNSARHYFATNAIVEWGWDYKTTAAHMGNSAQEIENRYSKHIANMLASKRMANVGNNKQIGSNWIRQHQSRWFIQLQES